jgi:hypothetical protein
MAPWSRLPSAGGDLWGASDVEAAMVIPERVTATMEGEFVVFLIGMRFNRPWKIHRWLPVVLAMPRMLKELYRQPEMGFLSANLWFGRTVIVVQYWRSFEALEAYALARDAAHLPAWKAFNQRVGVNGDVGIWHETYLIGPGQYENVYVNMPPFGLGEVGVRQAAVGAHRSASERLAARASARVTPRPPSAEVPP